MATSAYLREENVFSQRWVDDGVHDIGSMSSRDATGCALGRGGEEVEGRRDWVKSVVPTSRSEGVYVVTSFIRGMGEGEAGGRERVIIVMAQRLDFRPKSGEG